MKKTILFIISIVLVITMLLCGCSRNIEDNDVDSSDEKTNTLTDGDDDNPSAIHSDTPIEVETEESSGSSINVMVIANEVNIRKDKSSNSDIIGKADINGIYPVIDEGLDSDGKAWYLIEFDFASKGWIAGWLCEKTQEQALSYKSKKGELLNNAIDKDLYVNTLILQDYTLESFKNIFGDNYIINPDGAYTRYTYPNGLFFELYNDNNIIYFGFGEGYSDIRPDTITKKTCDILSNKGDELLIFFEYNLYHHLLICDSETLKVLREYNLGYLNLYQNEIGDFMNEGSLQLYLDGHGDGFLKKGIYKIANDDFIQVFDINAFSDYKKNIKPRLNGNNFSMDIQFEDYNESLESSLPNRVFCDTRSIEDKNALLTINSSWSMAKQEDKWYIKLRNTVDYPMIYYYWGPPGEDTEANEILYNDLAHVDLLLELQGDIPKISDIQARVKYDKPELLGIEPMGYAEVRLVNGPEVEMSVEDAYKALGGKIEDFVYSESMELNGVSLSEFCGAIVDITVTTSAYETPRGLRVGDTADKVESLYGKPDAGFSGDDHVIYKCGGEDNVNYYRGMDIRYKDNVVVSFTLYQVILD